MSGPQTIQIEIRSASVAKLENGYTRIANELLEALARCHFTAAQLRIIIIIARLTYGYKKRAAPISTRKIAEACQLKPWLVRYSVSVLISKNVLFRENGQRGEIGINNHVDQWQIYDDSPATSVGKCQHSDQDERAEIPTLSVGKSKHSELKIPTLAPNTPYKKKENFKEKGKESENPSPPANDFFGIQPSQIVEIWNQQRPSATVCPILPPKQQAEILATVGFLPETFGHERWPKHADDVLPWFADFFASIESGEQGKYLKERDFFYFMDSGRLYQSLEENRHG